MIQESEFVPAKGLRNPHLQSLFPTFARYRLQIERQRERLELPDGDFLDLDHIGKGEDLMVVILYGMADSAKSPYVKGLMQVIIKLGWRGVLMYYRGCSGQPNRLPQTYHLGRTDDLTLLFNYLHNAFPKTRLAAVGYSMGGNILLKWLGENPQQSLIQAAVAVSAPYDLRAASAAIRHGNGRFYQWLLLRDLRRYVNNKYRYPNAPVNLNQIADIKSFWNLDEKVTAPINGFHNAVDYYHRSSCGPWIKHITAPTLIIHAKDDPMIPASTIPTNKTFTQAVTLELSEHGGHVGFVGGSLHKPDFWLDKRIPKFLNEQLIVNNKRPQNTSLII